MAYDYKQIEKKWQRYWLKNKTFKAVIDHSKPKAYILDMFPYPSGSGLHVGHPEGYTATDIVSRYKRMLGINVLHCMGWDAFGLPAEQAAIKTGTHPNDTTQKNISTFKRQIIALGLSYDWDREINTTDKNYYKWTQWIFLSLFKKGLAYQDNAPVNWCPALKTVLANEEVIDGKSEIGDHPVYRKKMRQWLLKITAYADRLLEDIDSLDWSESIKEMQRNWIGKSNGAFIQFPVSGHTEKISVFTTRPDTVYGATFCVLAPEHPLVERLTAIDRKDAVNAYIKKCSIKSDLERTSDVKNKTGEFTGSYAINPLSGEKIPLWIADYVLGSYGTGAIMCVPAHDQRDHDFATRFSIKILPVVDHPDHDYGKEALTADGVLTNSPIINGLTVNDAKKKMIDHIQTHKLGEKTTTYKLRDWLFSRQRYWGEPIPILLDENKKPFPLDESELPLELPVTDNYQPSEDGESPLANIEDWVRVTKDGVGYSRETNTMPQWAGSCWYYLRFTDPTNNDRAWSEEAEKYWMPVDLYVGGAEHAVLHLLYARFWHKVLYDLGHVSTTEPFKKLVNQGMILGPDGQKMSKSRGNVVNPDDTILSHGADSLRLYEMFMGPLEKSKPWQINGIDGCFRFLNRVWNLIADDKKQLLDGVSETSPTEDDATQINILIKRVTDDIETMKFNTAISHMMTFVNYFSVKKERNKQILHTFVLLLSPFAPHIAEELWQILGHTHTLAYEDWPKHDPAYLNATEIIIPVQINGKLRDQIRIDKDMPKENVIKTALNREKIKSYLKGKNLVKEIYVPNKIVNLVIK